MVVTIGVHQETLLFPSHLSGSVELAHKLDVEALGELPPDGGPEAVTPPVQNSVVWWVTQHSFRIRHQGILRSTKGPSQWAHTLGCLYVD